MPTTSQMLVDYPDILLQVIAELRGAFLDAAENRHQAIDLLTAQITDPTSVLMAYQEVVDFQPQAQAALEALLSAGGELVEAQFSREFGSIRQMGPAKLEREMPWTNPQSVAELLFYYGFLGRGFKGAGQKAHTIVYIPADVIPWLPKPAGAAGESQLPVTPAPPPPASRMLTMDDAFLEDAGTLLGFLHTDTLRLTPQGPHPEDISRLVERLHSHGVTSPEEQDIRLALLLHLAKRLGWLRRDDENRVVLTGNRVRAFLEMNRAEQRFALWEAWRTSSEWNDLCRTPGLECANTGVWQNDPRQTRAAILDLLAQLQPGAWYSLSEVVAAIKEVAPDFQRPPGDYESWYIRDSSTQEFLKGFQHWDAVEGALLRFLCRGPLAWLAAMDLAEPSAGDDLLISLSPWGSRWLGQDAEQPNELPRRPLVVGEDFTVTVPPGTSLLDRFRVERFAQWQASYPQYRYQITQRGLARAAAEGITPQRVLGFLEQRSQGVPAKVKAALSRFQSKVQAAG